MRPWGRSAVALAKLFQAWRHVRRAWPGAIGAGDVGMPPAQGEDLAATGAKRADRSGATWYGVGSLLTSGAKRSG